MSFRKDLYDRTIHHKEFVKVKNKIYDILWWLVDYSISSVIAIEHPIGKGFFENVADTHFVEAKECKQIDFESEDNSKVKCDGRFCKLKEIYSTEAGGTGRLGGEKNRHLQRIWGAAGQHRGSAVLRNSAFPAFPGSMEAAPQKNLVCRGCRFADPADGLCNSGGKISPVCLAAHLAEQADRRRHLPASLCAFRAWRHCI